MKSLTIVRSVLVLVLFMGYHSAKAEDSSNKSQTSAKQTDNRMSRKLGAYIGILGDPHPTAIGFNVAYNVKEYLRASIGFGKISTGAVSLGDSVEVAETSMTTIGAAAKFLMPGWNLSPTATLGYSHISFDGVLTDADYKSSNLYFGLGGDWQAASGFNVGAGLNISMNGGAPTAPYVNLGMFF